MANDTGIVNIHGRNYQTVAYRVGKFREGFPKHTLETEIVMRDDECVVMKASILDEGGRLIATGHSEEYRASSTINKTSALENAETSAIGRALAAFGLGGTEFATADEVASAIKQQNTITPTSGLWEALPTDTQIQLNDLADETKALLRKGDIAGACNHLQSANLETDHMAAIWTRFDSKDRRAMKDHKQKKALMA